jgi:hypothetical protein
LWYKVIALWRKVWILLVFPGLWFASVIAVCSAYIWWGDFAVEVLGALSYAAAAFLLGAARAKRRGLQLRLIFGLIHGTVIVGTVYLSGFLTAVYAAYTRDPIGEGYERRDFAFQDCELPGFGSEDSITNATGELAVVRKVHCSSGPIGSTNYYFVFVRGSAGENNRSDLVFRFQLSGGDPGPDVTWSQASTIRIAVRTQILRITAQRNSIDGVHVVYRFGPTYCESALTPAQRAFKVVRNWLGDEYC